MNIKKVIKDSGWTLEQLAAEIRDCKYNRCIGFNSRKG